MQGKRSSQSKTDRNYSFRSCDRRTRSDKGSCKCSALQRTDRRSYTDLADTGWSLTTKLHQTNNNNHSLLTITIATNNHEEDDDDSHNNADNLGTIAA